MGKMAAGRIVRNWRRVGGTSFLGLLLIVAALFWFLQAASGVAFSQASAYGLKWNVPNPPTEGRAGLKLTFSTVQVTNEGTQDWISNGSNAVTLGYRWYTTDNKFVTPVGDTYWQDLRADLPKDIPPGGSVIFPDFQVSVPAKPGNYVLHLDLVQGSSGWFAEKGATDFTTKITVVAKDTTPPTASVLMLPLFEVSTVFTVTWNGDDGKDGSGVANYDVQYQVLGNSDWTDWLLNTSQTAAQFSGENGKIYNFRARAVDKAGNIGKYSDNAQTTTRINILPPSARVASLQVQSPSVFLVRWSGFDSVDGSDNQIFDVQYKDGDNGTWQDWISSTPATAAVFKGEAGHTYYFRCRATNYAGLRSDYSDTPQASTTVNPILDAGYSSQVVSATVVTISATNTVTATASPTVTATQAPSASTTATASTTPTVTDVLTGTVTPSGTAASGDAAHLVVLALADDVSGTATITTSIGASQPLTNTPGANPMITPTTTASATVTATASATPTATTTPAASGPQTTVFPLAVKNGTDDTGTSGIVVQNPSQNPLDVFVRFYDANGAPVTTTVNGVSSKTTPDQAQTISRIATKLITVPPNSSQTIWDSVIPVNAYNGWILLSADSGFNAWEVRLPKVGQPVTYASPTLSTTLYLPYLKKAGPTASSYVDLANPNTTPATVQITYYAAGNGQVVATEKLEIPMLGSLRLNTNNLIGDTNSAVSGFTGSAVITSTQALAGSVELPLADGTYASYPALVNAATTTGPLAFYSQATGYSSAVVIQNVSKQAASVKLDFVDGNGNSVASSTESVPAHSQVVVGQNALSSQPSFVGSVKATSDGAAIALVTIAGSSNLQANNQQFP